jgi:hypothetical protein
MAPVLKQSDDYVIINRSAPAFSGQWIDNLAILGPDLPFIGLQFQHLDDAKAKGRELAAARTVSL